MIRPSKIQLQRTAGRTQEVLMQTFSRPKTAKPGAASAPQISSAKKRTGSRSLYWRSASLRAVRAVAGPEGKNDDDRARRSRSYRRLATALAADQLFKMECPRRRLGPHA